MALSGYDSRQLNKMRVQLSAYKEGNLGLGELVDDLVFLRNALESCPIEWDLNFTEKLTDLESVNSYMLEKGDSKVDVTLQPIVDKAISAICELIHSLQ